MAAKYPAGALRCPYCQGPAELVTGEYIYPHREDLYDLQFWSCEPCDAYVGCHKAGAWTYDAVGRKVFSDGTLPLGRLANEELRAAKKRAHAQFDPLWNEQPRRYEARLAAYAWLAKALDIPVSDCHIGEFDVDMCARVVQVCQARPKTALGGSAIADAYKQALETGSRYTKGNNLHRGQSS
jgi:hypothetical protein